MKALTLHQPWASLVTEDVKTIETRSSPTEYRGSLAIHAAARRPDGPLSSIPTMSAVDGYELFYSHPEVLCARKLGDLVGFRLPLGAVVATCTLIDVVPIIGDGVALPPPPLGDRIMAYPHEGALLHQEGGLWLTGPRVGSPTRVEGQRPYGDFTSGRYAWLFADIVKLDEPVSASGRPGLWDWTP